MEFPCFSLALKMKKAKYSCLPSPELSSLSPSVSSCWAPVCLPVHTGSPVWVDWRFPALALLIPFTPPSALGQPGPSQSADSPEQTLPLFIQTLIVSVIFKQIIICALKRSKILDQLITIKILVFLFLFQPPFLLFLLWILLFYR